MYESIANSITRERVQEAYIRFICNGGVVVRLHSQNDPKYVNARFKQKGQNVPIHERCTDQH